MSRPAPRRTSAPRPRPWRPGWPVALAALFVVALAWRWVHLERLARSVLGGSLVEDARIYWDWSTRLLSRGPVGEHAFFMGPLYPYTLALLRRLTGGSVNAVLGVQAAWGAAACVLLADAARRLTRPAVGLAVGGLLAGFGMAVFFDGLVLMESLLFALEACLLWWVVRIGARGAGAGGLAASGALIGLLAQGRATSVLLLVPAALLAVSPGPGPRPAGRPKALRLGALALGCALVCLPAALHNLAVAREWIPFTYNLGYNLYVGNHPGATGGFGVITGSHEWSRVAGPRADGGADSDGRAYLRAARGLELGPSASSRHWTREALAWISAHPGQAARLALRRVAMMWNRSEYPQVEDAQTFASLLGPLGLPFVGTFAFLGTLAIAGLAGAWRRGPPGRFVVGYAVVMTLAIAPFFVTDRYRHHLVPAAALLAAVALERLAAWLADPRARSRSAGLFAGLAVGLVVVFLPLPRLSDAKRAWGTASDLGMRYMEKGDAASAAREFERAAAIESRGLAAPRPGSDLAVERAMTYHNHALALEALQRDAEALEWRRRAASLAPDHATIVRALADALADANRAAEAESLYARLEGLANGRGAALAGRGWLAARRGSLEEAERLFGAAAEADPGLGEAWGAWVRLAAQRGDVGAARERLERGRAAGWDGAGFAAHEALVSALEGRADAARAALARIEPRALERDPVIADVAVVARRVLAGADR
jgi:tetratricopeptide (TPR) repeat protein